MTVYLLLGLCGAALALLLTPLVSRGSIRLGLVDAPGGRKVHPHSVPRLGGVAVVTATMLAMILVSLWRAPHFGPAIWTSLQPLIAAGALIFGIGVLDDVRGVGPLPKLAVEAVAAGVMMASGLLIERVTVMGVSWELGWLAFPVTVVILFGITAVLSLLALATAQTP